MFMLELGWRAKVAGLDLVSLASHPGIASSNLLRGKGTQSRPSRGVAQFIVASVQRLLGQSAAAGALPSLCAATDPELRGGEYVGPGGLGHQVGRRPW